MPKIELDVKRDLITSNIQHFQMMYIVNGWAHYIRVPRDIVIRDIFKMKKNPSQEMLAAHVEHNLDAFLMIEKYLIDNELECALKFRGQYTEVALDTKIFERHYRTSMDSRIHVYGKVNSKKVVNLLSKLVSPAALLLATRCELAEDIIFSTPEQNGYASRAEMSMKELVKTFIK